MFYQLKVSYDAIQLGASQFVGLINYVPRKDSLNERNVYVNCWAHYVPSRAHCGRRGGLMVSVLHSGSSCPCSGPGWGHCVVFLGKTLYSHGASLHPGV